MTNMMNGAVAIYGGVGVMEIRQPLPQAVESVAQAVEALAVNAHISLRELKNCVDKVLEKKIPGYKQLMEMNPVVAATENGHRYGLHHGERLRGESTEQLLLQGPVRWVQGFAFPDAGP